MPKTRFLSFVVLGVSLLFAHPALAQFQWNSAGLKKPDLVRAVYEKNQNQPIWSVGGTLHKQEVKDYLKVSADLEQDGLNPEDYHLKRLQESLEDGSVKIEDLDALLTDSFLTATLDLTQGRVSPTKIYGDWFYTPAKTEAGDVLLAAASDKKFAATLKGLLPDGSHYTQMRAALKHYQEHVQKGGWPKVTVVGKKWEPGEKGAHIVTLRNRLLVTGELTKKNPVDPELYDDDLIAAVKKFQRQNGLNGDGVVGIYSFEALNKSAEDRVKQIKVNMERYRWLPRELGDKFIFVNIPDYRIYVMVSDRSKFTLRGVVGNVAWRTPYFFAAMDHIVLNPRWNVPPRIARKEMLPNLQSDANYLSNKRFKVFQKVDGQSVQVDPSTVDWTSAEAGDFSFSQDSGGGNALGKIKFMFPNKHSIYLHDTPSKSLFKNDIRAYSHGCVRVENPLDLAEYLLGTDPSLTKDKIQAHVDTGRERVLVLQEKLPIYLYYLTAWAADDGQIQFRKDVYDYDAKLARALKL